MAALAAAAASLVAALLLQQCLGSLILSKSDLDVCTNTGDPRALKCSKKILMTLTVPSGQTGADSVIVAEVKDPSARNGKQILSKPMDVRIGKSDSKYVYKMFYQQNVNADVYEHVIYKSKNCQMRLDEKASCGVVKDGRGNLIPGSQGFCCQCEKFRKYKYFRGQKRPGGCGGWSDPGYAFCLRYGDMWYRTYRIGLGVMNFQISIQMNTEDGTKTMQLSPAILSGINSDRTLMASLSGDLASYTQVPVLDGKIANFPDTSRVTGRWREFTKINPSADPNLWILLDQSRYALTGMTCDKIGLNYEGYQRQPQGCQGSMGMCIRDQLIDFLKEDRALMRARRQPVHSVVRYGRPIFRNNPGESTLEIVVPPTMSILTLELAANKISFVKNKSPGKILSATVRDFEAMSSAGKLIVTVQNTGTVYASYGLFITCTGNIIVVPGKTVGLTPNLPHMDTIELSTQSTNAAKYSCDVILKDSEGEQVDQRSTTFSTTVTMFNNGNQNTGVVVGGRKNDTFSRGGKLRFGRIGGFFKKTFSVLTMPFRHVLGNFKNILGSCGSCPGYMDLFCFIKHFCIKRIIFLAAGIVGVALAIYLIVLLQSMGLLGPICAVICFPLHLLWAAKPSFKRSAAAEADETDSEAPDEKPARQQQQQQAPMQQQMMNPMAMMGPMGMMNPMAMGMMGMGGMGMMQQQQQPEKKSRRRKRKKDSSSSSGSSSDSS